MTIRGGLLFGLGGGLSWLGWQVYRSEVPMAISLVLAVPFGGGGLSLMFIGSMETILTIFSRRENRAHCFLCRNEREPRKILAPKDL